MLTRGFVDPAGPSLRSNKEEREEGGTPDILGSIRLGLAVQMKEALGYRAIMVSGGISLSSHQKVRV